MPVRARRRRAIPVVAATVAAGLIATAVAMALPAAAAATRYEAEQAVISLGQVNSDHAGYSGTGFVNYDNATGSYVQWTVSAPVAGSASLAFRYANGTTVNRPMNVSVNGTVVSSGLSFAGTGAWSTWATRTVTVTLPGGTSTVRATATTANGGPNVDYLTATTSDGPTTPPATTTPPASGTPVSINGQLHVCGVNLCNRFNRPIQLRGMSTHGIQWYPQCVNAASLDALATDWQADIVRISMYIQEDGYETNPRLFTDRVHSLIDMVSARGMYALVDWHMLDPGDPAYNLARARTFFTEIAQRHASKPNILYEVANEPNGVSWAQIKSYHEQIVPVIRAQDPDSVILLGTRAWSSLGLSDGAGPEEIFNSPVNATNVMYTFHFYAASHGADYRDALSRAADRIPMFVTEFGLQEYTGDGPNNLTSAQQYIDLMASKKISWTQWNFSDDFRSGAALTTGTCPSGPFAGTSRLKDAGRWIRDRIRTPDNFPTS